MLQRHIFLYLGSRGTAALINLASLSIFARMAGPDMYGSYLVIVATAAIVYGLGGQWAMSSFFARYRHDAAGHYISTLLAVLMAAIALAIVGAVVAALLLPIAPSFLAAMVALVAGLSLFHAAAEVARTRLQAGTVALSVLIRAVTMLVLGVFALTVFKSATALALAVAAGNVLGAIPSLLRIAPELNRTISRPVAIEFIRYGMPLIFAFGIAALGQNIDRMLLAAWIGTGELGAYGAVSDLIKQLFFVMGEAIALTFVSAAKNAAIQNDQPRTEATLKTAFLSLFSVAVFGCAFVFVFGDVILSVLLGSRFTGGGLPYLPLLLFANALQMLRAFYFGQVIYFSESSRLELIVSLLMVVVAIALSILLIPPLQTVGAAMAFLGAQATGLVAFIALGRLQFALPVPLRPMLAIAALGAFFVTMATTVTGHIVPPAAVWAVNLTILIGCVLFAIQRFNVFGLRIGS